MKNANLILKDTVKQFKKKLCDEFVRKKNITAITHQLAVFIDKLLTVLMIIPFPPDAAPGGWLTAAALESGASGQGLARRAKLSRPARYMPAQNALPIAITNIHSRRCPTLIALRGLCRVLHGITRRGRRYSELCSVWRPKPPSPPARSACRI